MWKCLPFVFLAGLAAAAPPRCKIAPAPPDALFVGPKRARLPLGSNVFEDDTAGRRPHLGVVPRVTTWLAGVSGEWLRQGGGSPDGRLFDVTCGKKPSVRVVLERDGVDFARMVTLDGGMSWIAGGNGGLVRVDAATLAVLQLTTPPKLTVEQCPQIGTEEGVVQSDVLPVVGPRPGEVTFIRGAGCGYEGDFTGHTLILDMASGATRAPRSVSAVAESADGALWAGDAAACDEPGPDDPQTPGVIFRSKDGGASWTRVPLVDKPGATAGGWEPDTAVADVLADPRDARRLVVRTARCESGAQVRGGSLFETRDGGVSWKAIPPPDGLGDTGMGLAAARRVGPTLDALAAASLDEGSISWRKTVDGGRTWQRLQRSPTVRWRPSATLARALGVAAVHGTLRHAKTGATLAWTTDGLYRRVGKEWVRLNLP